MSTALLIGAVLVAVLACPAIMWWQSRRGAASCCAPGPRGKDSSELAELRLRHEQIGARIAAMKEKDADGRRVADSHDPKGWTHSSRSH